MCRDCDLIERNAQQNIAENKTQLQIDLAHTLDGVLGAMRRDIIKAGDENCVIDFNTLVRKLQTVTTFLNVDLI